MLSFTQCAFISKNQPESPDIFMQLRSKADLATGLPCEALQAEVHFGCVPPFSSFGSPMFDQNGPDERKIHTQTDHLVNQYDSRKHNDRNCETVV